MNSKTDKVKYYIVNLKMRNKISNSVTTAKAICMDGECYTTYSDPQQTNMTYKSIKKRDPTAKLDNGVIKTIKKDQKAKDIMEKTINDIKNLQDQLKSLIEITYKVEEAIVK